MNAVSRLLNTGPHIIDGGLATELETRGHDLTGVLWSARVLRDEPAAIRDVHEAYFRAGASVGISASYQVSRSGFLRAGLTVADADELLASSVALVREARERVTVAWPTFVAASVGPFGATLHDGSEYRGHYGVSHDELVQFHVERLPLLAAAGPDLLAIETVPDVEEAKAIMEALRVVPAMPAWLSYSCADGHTTCAGQPFAEAVEVAALAPTVVAVGINCTAPEHVLSLIIISRSVAPDLPVVVYPNAGRVWDGSASQWRGDGSDHMPRQAINDWVNAGATLIGGCCGLGPLAISTASVDLGSLTS